MTIQPGFRAGGQPNDMSAPEPSRTLISLQQSRKSLLEAWTARAEEDDSPSQSQSRDTPTGRQYPPSSAQEDSQIWKQAIRNYYNELEKGGIKGPALDKGICGTLKLQWTCSTKSRPLSLPIH